MRSTPVISLMTFLTKHVETRMNDHEFTPVGVILGVTFSSIFAKEKPFVNRNKFLTRELLLGNSKSF